jgi:hypothetical protein
MLAVDANDFQALNGRAQNAAWRGRTAVAEAQYLAVLEIDGDNVDALLGLARLLHDQGRPRAAGSRVSLALRLAPDSRDATTLRRQIRAAQRPQVEPGFGVSWDSDRNVSWSRTMTASFPLADGLRGSFSGGSLDASDPVRDASRAFGEVGLVGARGPAQLTLVTGAHWLDPSSGPSRRASNSRVSLSVRAFDRLSTGVGFGHAPLDETALLIGSGLQQNELQGSLDADLAHGLALSAGGGAAWLSDGNHRASALVAVMRSIGGLGSAGALGRVLSFDHAGAGYFSPDRFALGEARVALARSRHACTGRLNAGLGGQQVGERASLQLAWRASAEAQYDWATVNRLVVSIGASNSAASSTTGAYRYLAATLALRVGL